MKKIPSKLILIISVAFIISLVILFVVIFSINSKYSRLNTEYSSFKQSSAEQVASLESNIDTLTGKNDELTQKNDELSQESEALNKQYTLLKTDVDSTIKKIDTYETELESSMDWFKFNSNLDPNSNSQKDIFFSLEQDCLKKTSDSCFIKSACLPFINIQRLTLGYKYDTETTQQEERLQSLSDFIKNKGGDCEDWALFFKAEFNYLLSKCSGLDIALESFYIAESYQQYYVDVNKNYLFAEIGATPYNLAEGYIYPNVVCGEIYDLNTNEVSGHCIIAFTKDKIKTKSDLRELDKAPLIEPQTGMFYGLINDPSSEIGLSSEEGMNLYTDSYIYMVITDEDLFLFSSENEWLSYSIFNDELESNKNELINLKK
jgi:cell division protein FtsB